MNYLNQHERCIRNDLKLKPLFFIFLFWSVRVFAAGVASDGALKAFLQEKGIPTAVHYPRPLHLQPCFSGAGYQQGDFPIAEQASQEVLSLPMCAFTQKADQEFIIQQLIEAVTQNGEVYATE